MKNWKTTLCGVLTAICIALSQAIPEYANVFTAAGALFGSIGLALAGDASNTAKTILLLFILSFSTATTRAQSIVDDGQRFHNVWISAPQPENAILINRAGMIASDTLKVLGDSTMKLVTVNPRSKTRASLQTISLPSVSYLQIASEDSFGVGGVVNTGSGNDGFAVLDFETQYSDVSGGVLNNKISIDSGGVSFEKYNSDYETLDSFHLPKYSWIQWNGNTTSLGIVCGGQISTTSGRDTIYLTTTGFEGGEPFYSSSSNYTVNFTNSSDSVSYSYKVTKAANYFTVLVRQNNILNHWATVADATKVDYVVVGN